MRVFKCLGCGQSPRHDITDIDGIIVVHNTDVNITKQSDIFKLVERIKNAKKRYRCLSCQDQHHTSFYKDNNIGITIKLVFGPLDARRVGIINHCDAYSQSINEVEIANFEFIRR